MNVMLDTLRAGLPQLGLSLPQETQEKLCAFGEAVVQSVAVFDKGTVGFMGHGEPPLRQGCLYF